MLGVVPRELLHRCSAIELNLQKLRRVGLPDPGKGFDDHVVDVVAYVFRFDADIEGGVEHFEKVPHAGLAAGQAKIPVGLKAGFVGCQIVGEGHRVQPEVA